MDIDIPLMERYSCYTPNEKLELTAELVDQTDLCYGRDVASKLTRSKTYRSLSPVGGSQRRMLCRPSVLPMDLDEFGPLQFYWPQHST